MGFASCGQDGFVFFYDLQLQKEQQTRNQDRDFHQKNIKFTGLCNIPGQKYNALVVGDDRHIWRTSDPDSKTSCDTKYVISQVQYLASGKAFFAGVGEDSRPGSI